MLRYGPTRSRPGSSLICCRLGTSPTYTRFYVWPLEHLWSLSVEEHFYMLWPFAVLWLSRNKLQTFLVTLVLVLPIARLASTYLLPRHAPNVIYYLTPFRIDGIALGCLLALLLEETLGRRY